jgi:hypothetical protein
MDQRDIVVIAEHGDDFIGLVEPHQAVVDEHAGELVADGLVDQHRGHRGLSTPPDRRADHPALADLRTDLFDRALRGRPTWSSRT